jgi:hypothetical protein
MRNMIFLCILYLIMLVSQAEARRLFPQDYPSHNYIRPFWRRSAEVESHNYIRPFWRRSAEVSSHNENFGNVGLGRLARHNEAEINHDYEESD